MATKGGLGKGLGALLGDAALQDQQEGQGSLSLPISQVQPAMNQPRKRFDEEALADLSESIRIHGVIQPLTVRRLAEEVYLTPSYLSGLFKKHTGKTISQYLTEIRIEYSMNLLMDKQIKISRIAEMAGYNDANYLTKTFKSHVGMTPTEYRNRYRKK